MYEVESKCDAVVWRALRYDTLLMLLLLLYLYNTLVCPVGEQKYVRVRALERLFFSCVISAEGFDSVPKPLTVRYRIPVDIMYMNSTTGTHSEISVSRLTQALSGSTVRHKRNNGAET